MTNRGSHVVGNCTNFSCEGGQHCNATKDGPESLDSKTNCNDQGNDRVFIFHRPFIKTGFNLLTICYIKINKFIRISVPLIITNILVIPPNSNTFSDWRKTCNMDMPWVKTQ